MREPDMRKRLKSIGIDVPGKATYEEVQTLYKQKENGIHDHFEVQIKGDVTMPILPTKALHTSQNDFTRLKKVKVFGMEQLVLDKDKISLSTACAFIHILASFSSIEARPKGQKLSYKLNTLCQKMSSKWLTNVEFMTGTVCVLGQFDIRRTEGHQMYY